jgi:hypothetical protein
VWAVAAVSAQRRDAFVESRDHAAIAYTSGPTDNPVTRLNARLRAGAPLAFDPVSGYLRAVLDALSVPVESQSLVFSQTSFQADRINIHNPRALYFNDAVAVGWVRGGTTLEVAVQDPQRGTLFYELPQQQGVPLEFKRNEVCLSCHLSWETRGVPGLMVTSMFPLPDDPNAYANGFTTVQGSPLTQRWGGWWVTGDAGGVRHMGNIPVMPMDKGKGIPNPTRTLASVEGLFNLEGYQTPYSDVVALLVLAHQTQMTDLLTRLGWEARVAAARPTPDAEARVREAAVDAVDHALFIDEAPLPKPVKGTSGFAERFAGAGPKDAQGRSLRDFDLTRRLFRHPCSYLIYSDAFEGLPPAAKEAFYARLWTVLSAKDGDKRYREFGDGDRRAVVEILLQTKKDLPPYIQPLPAAAARPAPAAPRPKSTPRTGAPAAPRTAAPARPPAAPRRSS